MKLIVEERGKLVTYEVDAGEPASVAEKPADVEDLHTEDVENLHTEGEASQAPSAPVDAPKDRFSLDAIEGEHAGKKFAIERFPFKIGRTRKNALQVHDSGVSGE